MTFERKVAVQYLAHLLVGDGAVELGDDRRVVSVAFQQAPSHPVDDLVVHAAYADESEPSLVVAVGVRRSPNLVQSDERTRQMFRQFLDAAISAPADGPDHRLCLVVSGPQPHAQQLAELTRLASAQKDAPGFFYLVRTPNKFAAVIRDRLDHIEKLVRHALRDIGEKESDETKVQHRTWQMLSVLTVRMPRLETPDETDWTAVKTSLTPMARGSDLEGASRLRDRLVALADEYSPKAARVDLTLLRRDTHVALDEDARRNKKGWQALRHLHDRAFGSVSDRIASSDGDRCVHLERKDTAAVLATTMAEASALVVTGESGVGKSALALHALTTAEAECPDTVQGLCINLRQVPKLTVEFESILGCPLSTLLSEMSAPQRLLVVDGADAAGEGREATLRYLVDAAQASDVKVIAITAADTQQIVRDNLSERFGESVAEFTVPPLADTEIEEVIQTFPELGNLNANPRSRELLRRLVLVDLLVRGRFAGVPLTDADAMNEVWSGLVRRREAFDRGSPQARETTLLRLAALELSGGDRLESMSEIDLVALDGLRRDGLLRTSPDNPFMIGPEFAHDEVRRYAVARLLLAGGTPASRLLQDGCPRWALAASQLACQALLALPDTADVPVRGRFATLQDSFDAIVDAGYGARWGDVPGEALLALAEPDTVLRDAWPEMNAEGGAGLRRLARLVDQRLRSENGLVNTVAIEPIISLLLEDYRPWGSGEHAQLLLREWLRALIFQDTTAGHPLRVLLRQRLIAACKAGDRRLAEQIEAAAAARAALTPEEVEQERARETQSAVLYEMAGRRHRQRPQVPHEITDETVLEMLALLGPDLGSDGEDILRRVAQDAPSMLGPALESPFTGNALASYQRGFLADLTEAYYLDEDADGSSTDEGIRRHQYRGHNVFTGFAWHLGPFYPLFRNDFRNGVAVLNRLLNHAASIREKTLARLDQTSPVFTTDAGSLYGTDLDITGESRRYRGDSHVWRWYRGTGVGPYPCFSALQALERVCDDLIGAGVPIRNLISILLSGCENLAMVGLVVGILVRHLEKADRLLDPFLVEPLIWQHESTRVANEMGERTPSSEGLVAPDRRIWQLQQTAMTMVLGADVERAAQLRSLGEALITKARLRMESALDSGPTDAQDGAHTDFEQQLATVRAWASILDRGRYQVIETPDGLSVQVTQPDDVAQELQPELEDGQRLQEDLRLSHRYYVRARSGDKEAIGPSELAADINAARKLFEGTTSLDVHDRWDTPALVSAAALEAHLLQGIVLPIDLVVFAAETVLRIGEGEAWPQQFDSETSYFQQGADRSAARTLPLLLLPTAQPLSATINATDGRATFDRIARAGINLSRAIASEVRLHLARGLDHLWKTPCAKGRNCHHEVGLRFATETMRYCLVGNQALDHGQNRKRPKWYRWIWRRVSTLDKAFTKSLADPPDRSILPHRLDAAIRALAPAATANNCISTRAHDLLMVVLAAQRRSLLHHKRRNVDYRGTHTLVSARALLTMSEQGDDTATFAHIDAYADNSELLNNLLRALSAAAEETPERAATARRIWPNVIRHMLNLEASGHKPFHGRHFGDLALAALIPNAMMENTYLYSEVQGTPTMWWEPLALRSEVEEWLVPASGKAACADQLISFLSTLESEDQARTGLPWVATVVLADTASVARRSSLLTEWLIGIRPAAVDAGLSTMWQKVVDALVVAGVTPLAAYSE